MNIIFHLGALDFIRIRPLSLTHAVVNRFISFHIGCFPGAI